jgi:Fe-S-cluster-containing dehydrogenase component/anaerobic selenocysteine-containing dehydrogenase
MGKLYWQSLEDYKDQKNTSIPGDKNPDTEFSIEGLDESEIKGKSSRRDFLKLLGFSVSAVALVSSCQMPVRKAIPLLNQPEDVIPGVANYYASTFFDGIDYCSILVKTRENRPIKIEGNEMSPLTKGGTSARVQASVLNLYDDARLKEPQKDNKVTDWDTNDKEIINQLNKLNESGEKVVLLTSTIISPTTTKLIEEFITKFPNVEWISYDPISFSAMREANEINFGSNFIPTYSFDKAKIIVGFNADYLGNWLMPVAFSKQYSKNRKLDKVNPSMSRSYQFESSMSLTGANADYRYGIRPSEESVVLLNLYNEIAKATGLSLYNAPQSQVDIKKVASDLLSNKGNSLVVSGTNDLNIQLIVNAINNALGNYNVTIDINTTTNLNQGNDKKMQDLVKEMNDGSVGGILFYNVNPVYDYNKSVDFVSGLEKVKTKISFADTMDETAAKCEFICPDSNYLESWNDAEPVSGNYSIIQPTIRPIFNTRQFQDSLLIWMENSNDFSIYMEENWKATLSESVNFESTWNKIKHDGVYQTDIVANTPIDFKPQGLNAGSGIKSGVELFVYQKIGMGIGKYANNPWLQELPDPVTTATWDNYLAIPPSYAEENNLKLEDVVKVNGIKIPVLVQPGQPKGTVAIAIGYGRTSAGKAGNNVGKNAFGFIHGEEVTIEKTGSTYPLALTQMHHDMEERPIVRETSFKDYKKDPASGNELHAYDEKHNVTLYNKIDYDGLHWGMSIDLSSCTGCGNCVIACQAENNVAVIGKEQVKNRRIMHWIRIDRYYSRDENNPEVFHMPVMCQHCDNAPCENVCPVAATNHSTEGLNQMAYNRCIGTRYCVNNCPYKVRRFNWFEFTNNKEFDYNMNSELGKMVLNPDVIVRQRGVVEKCSMCVQRIQEGKLVAKMENRELKDGDIKMACEQSCPTNAIQFGNLLDDNSIVKKETKSPRMYHLLEGLHTLPSTSYLTRVRNNDV